MKRLVSKLSGKLKGYATSELDRGVRDSLFLSGQMAAWNRRAIGRIRDLSDVEFRVFSQWGEDGILDWLIERLGLPRSKFVEFGVEDYRESNTRFLLMNRGWSGLVIDGSGANVSSIRADPISWKYDLQSVSSFITKDNINGILSSHGFRGEIGLLSIDIDGVDFWIWDAIDAVDPIIVVCEYNASLGDLHPLSVPYRADFSRSAAHSSNLYWGASLPAFEHLAGTRGYVLVGSNLAGTNAFFVRSDHADKLTSAIESKAGRMSWIRDSRADDGSLSFLRFAERAKAIGDMPFVRVDTRDEVTLAGLGRIYSDAWSAQAL